MAFTSLHSTSNALLIISATFGLVVVLVVIAGGRVSGAHIDPAVSLAVAISGKLSRDLLLPYVLSQSLGAVVAGVVLRIMFPASLESRFLGSTLLGPGISPLVGIFIEIAGTFVLSLVALTVLNRFRSIAAVSILVGATVFLLILLMAPYTSAALNPARSLGPALASGHLDDLEVYLIGPTCGGMLAGFLVRRLEMKTREGPSLHDLTPTVKV